MINIMVNTFTHSGVVLFLGLEGQDQDLGGGGGEMTTGRKLCMLIY